LATLRQVDRQRQPHRTCADHDDRMLSHVHARPVLVGVAAVTELGLGLRHAGSTL
jgi:hypothetical protein